MSMSNFILTNLEAILMEWEKFAETLLPITRGMEREALRDGARGILTAIAQDMSTPQSAEEQQAKSRGRRPSPGADHSDSSAQSHAAHRLSQGFDLNEMVSEYRALRASVIRLWTRHQGQADQAALDELTRFNEAIDQSLTEAIARYFARLNRSKDLLLAVLGHDLRNPLGAILQSAQFLLKSDALDSQYTKAASRIVNSGTRMKQMISDLLDFARTRLGDRLPIDPSPMAMGDACSQAISEIGASYPDCTLRFESTGELSGTWDSARIGQMLSNLLGNAVQHGSTEAPVSLAASGKADEVVVTVHNHGTPIPENEVHRIFEPLARADESSSSRPGSAQSLGLGLYIAREIAKAHGGTLELVSSDESGTTFEAHLPRQLGRVPA
jgi:signal transduction histidine kinase